MFLMFLGLLLMGLNKTLGLVIVILGFMSVFTESKPSAQKKVSNCPPHKWEYDNEQMLFCKSCGKKPTTVTDENENI